MCPARAFSPAIGESVGADGRTLGPVNTNS